MIILLILQNETVNKSTGRKLLLAGYQVITTSNSSEALSVLRQERVDVVVTEVEIGDLDGWRLARLLRSGILASSIDVPIILITETYAERIAETTAAMFDINRVVSYQNLEHIDEIIPSVLDGENNLNTPKNILVIEDAEDTSNLVKRMLKHKFLIDIAEDGPSGIQAFQEKVYSIVLLDIMMPGMSGDEVLSIILEMKPSQTVIVMTAHGTIDLAELLLKKGAIDYIQKPFKAEQLRNICDIAEKREDFLIANEQFSAKSLALSSEQQRFHFLSKTHYRILDSLNSIVIELTPTGNISFVNNAWYTLSGFLVSESVGKRFTDFIFEPDEKIKCYVSDVFSRTLDEAKANESMELQLKKQNGDVFWANINLSSHLDEDNNIVGMSGIIDDVSERKKSEDLLKHVALHDALTGIHNRFYFDNEIKAFSKSAKYHQQTHSLLYLDLDHFKVINDSQGHHQGDLVLKEIAQLLKVQTKDSDLLCRIGGDEFAIILTDTSVEQAKAIATEITKVIAESSFCFSERIYKVSCSIGITVIDGQALSSDLYLQRADIAMYVAKERGRNRVHAFSESDKPTDKLKQSFEWVQRIQQSITEDNIVLHFQPIIDVKSRTIDCYEALVRLFMDDELIFPDNFIPFLEKAEDMSLLDRHVIGKTLSLMNQYPLLTRVAINLSAQAFTDDRLFSFIADKLALYDIKPERVIFELTESASLSNITATKRMVNKLKAHGCQFSIDDFGTGFSTFEYLKLIPADSVKIDGSFVKDMLNDPIDMVLVKSINEMAHALGKTTVAEFVEDEVTLLELEKLGVDYAQGYHIARPVGIDQLLSNDNLTFK